MEIELNDQMDVQANKNCGKNDRDKNDQNWINEREEKIPKNINSNLKTLASMTEPLVEPVKKNGGALAKGDLKIKICTLKFF